VRRACPPNYTGSARATIIGPRTALLQKGRREGKLNTVILPEQRREEWNDFVAASKYGDVLQCWEWGELKARTGWQPLRVAVERDGQIAAACLVLRRAIPLLGGCLLYAPRGPIVDFTDESLWSELLAEIRHLANEQKAVAFKIDPAIPIEHERVGTMLRAAGFRPRPRIGELGATQPRYVMKMDISADPDDLIMQFKSKTRYNIRLAKRKGVVVTADCTRDDIAEFYRILQITAQRDGFLIRDISYFYDLWDLIIQHGLGRMFLAYVGEELVAGTIAFVLRQQAWYVYGASSNRYREKMPNYALQWEMMQWARAQGCRVFDMRGVVQEIDGVAQGKLDGLNRFKQGFAARYVEYIGEWDLIFRPVWYKLFTTGEPMIRSLRKMIANFRPYKG